MSFISVSDIFCHVLLFLFFFNRGDATQGKMGRAYPRDDLPW